MWSRRTFLQLAAVMLASAACSFSHTLPVAG
ncbi:twin-arginine translocation signal domain-containing protein [Teredinibacter franksiae]